MTIISPICNILPKLPLPIKIYCQTYSKFASFSKNRLNLKSWGGKNTKGLLFLGENVKRNEKRVVLVNYNINGGGGGENDEGKTVKLLGNIGLAIGLAYLSFSGQLGWVLDTIVSLWLLSIALPIVGFGLFVWWARRDIVQTTCPNCSNDFQVFKSSLNDEVQVCPFCSQPFSVESPDFVKEPSNFSNQSTPFGQAFDARRSGKGKDASTAIVDIEAEVRDIE